MKTADYKKSSRISFLISLVLHAVLALVLGLILLDNPQEEAVESIAVDISKVARNVLPPRRMEMRESIPDLRQPRIGKARTSFKPQRFNPKNIREEVIRQPRLSDTTARLPGLATDAERLKSRFEISLPAGPTGANITKPGADTRSSSGGNPRGGSVGLSGEAGIFESALYWIARNIASKNSTGKEDVVFLVDASGTMEDNIAAVARYIGRMLEVLNESKLDYTLGVIKFNRILKNNDIKIYDQTKDANRIRTILRSIKCDGDERTLDAIALGLTQVKFRNPVDKTFILVTDEAFTPRTITRETRKDLLLKDMLQLDFQEILKMCQNDNVKVNVLGIDDEMHKSLSKETEGLWFQIPQSEEKP